MASKVCNIPFEDGVEEMVRNTCVFFFVFVFFPSRDFSACGEFVSVF